MIARVLAVALCSIVVEAFPNSTESTSTTSQLNTAMDQRDEALQERPPLPTDVARTDSHFADDAMVDDAIAARLRGSTPSAVVPGDTSSTTTTLTLPPLSRRRRRRRKSSTDPCSGIETAVCKTSEYIFCYGGCSSVCFGISSCTDACEKDCKKKLYDPCVDSLKSACADDALALCEMAIEEAEGDSCSEICVEAAATADAAGGGPEDPAADVVAAEIAASCDMACEEALEDGEAIGTDAFGKAVCKGIGF